MRHLQTYRLFESDQTLTSAQKSFLKEYTQGSWSINPSTGLVDIKGNFSCSNCGLKDLQGIRFGVVTGYFSCHTNYITSLEGAPQTVGGDFTCHNNKITSLSGAPQTVGGNFNCNDNKLTSLSGAPQTVGGYFSCHTNYITSLAGTPQIIKGGLYCSGNKLTSLEGAPQTIEENFTCYDNKLTSLEGAPETVGGKFSSDDLDIPRGKWGIEAFVDLLKTGTPKQKQLVATLVDPKVLQQQIDENPERMLVKLKGVLKHPHFQGLKWPQRIEQEKDLLSDLSDIGL